jgi:Concanavalin A-like lectin/glucanases superfamily
MSIKSLIASDSFIKTKRFNISNTAIPVIGTYINVYTLVVAGGGGGGNQWGGGGGAGGLTYNSNYIIATNINYPIVIGAGGAGSLVNSVRGGNGTSSSFSTITTTGGGGGGTRNNNTGNYPQSLSPYIGSDGGSGGGACSKGNAGGANTLGQGYAGGSGLSDNSTYDGGGGGGGAGAVGGNGGSSGGAGGSGLSFNFANGTPIAYAGGGGGGSTGTAGAAGTGGGAAGGGGSTNGSNANTGYGGGGGGGSSTSGTSGGNGGSGTVIVSYPLPQQWTGGIVTNNNGTNVVHTFTSSGTMSALSTPIDTYQPYNTLLLHADGTNGANNSVFLDSSSNTYIPFNGTYSNYFNGSTDYLTTSLFSTTLNTWTMELWIFTTATTAYMNFVHHGNGTNWGSNYYFDLMLNSSSIWLLSGASSGNLNLQGTTVVNDGKWHHISVTYDGSTYRLFIDGILNAYQVLGSLGSSTNAFYIGYDPRNAGRNVTGYISNFRFVDGSVVYPTSSTTTGTVIFNPPVTPLTSITNTVLLTCQSNKFVDNSSLALSITPTGSPTISAGGNAIVKTGTPTQGTFSPFATTGWSNYFNGSTDSLIPTTSGYSLSTNWTVEFWFFTSTGPISGGSVLFDCRPTSTNGFYPQISLSSNTNIYFYYNGNVNSIITPDYTNRWNHVAVVKNGTNLNFYLNGTSVFNTTDSNSWAVGTNRPAIAVNGYTTTLSYFPGYISNVRLVNGTAVYTSNFTPPTAPLTPIANTSFLTCANSNFIGSNTTTSNVAITVGGTPQVQPFSPFNPTAAYSNTSVGGSLYLNGSTDYLTLPSSTSSLYLTGAFTWEAWVYPTSTSGPQNFYGNWNNNTNNNWAFVYNNSGLSGLKLYWYRGNYGSNEAAIGTTNGLTINQWNHIAFVRDISNNIYIFINGVSQTLSTYGSGLTWSNSYAFTSTESIGIGGTSNYKGFPGYISNMKFVQGIANYTSNFTPPTSPATASANTQLLLNSTNAGIIDSSQKNSLITYGTAAISTTQSKFGGSSISLNGSTDYVNFNPGFVVGTSAYTFECWFYLNNTTFSTYYTLFGNSVGSSAALNIRLNSTTVVQIDSLLVSNSQFTLPFTLAAGQWYHIAITRDSNNLTNVWLNGVSSTTGFTTVSTNYTGNTNTIGVNNDSGLKAYFPGYIDELRITKGYARYTANFTPPTSAFLNT